MEARNISGYGKVLSLRPYGPPLPFWRKRHLPRIGGVCLAEGGKSFSLRPHQMPLRDDLGVQCARTRRKAHGHAAARNAFHGAGAKDGMPHMGTDGGDAVNIHRRQRGA